MILPYVFFIFLNAKDISQQDSIESKNTKNYAKSRPKASNIESKLDSKKKQIETESKTQADSKEQKDSKNADSNTQTDSKNIESNLTDSKDTSLKITQNAESNAQIESKEQKDSKTFHPPNITTDSTPNIESKAKADSKDTESKTQIDSNNADSKEQKDSKNTSLKTMQNADSKDHTESKAQADSNAKTDSKNTESKAITLPTNPYTAEFPLLDSKNREKLYDNPYLDSQAPVTPQALNPLTLLPLEEWRGTYTTYMYNFTPMYNPQYYPYEMRFHLSFRSPLIRNLFNSGGIFYFAFTTNFFFQLFNEKASSPVRDMDFQPEFLYTYPMNLHFWGGTLIEITTGWRHISNGEIDKAQGGTMDKSRGSDRWILKAIWRTKHFGVDFECFFPVRFYPENPHIYRYMGAADLKLFLRYDKHLADATFQGLFANFLLNDYSRWYGGLRLSYTYKFSSYVGVYVQYFVGYGDYLYEYNTFGHRLGLGLRFVR